MSNIIPPYEEKDKRPIDVDVTVSLCVSKTVTVQVTDYEENHYFKEDDTTHCDFYSAVQNQIVMVHELADVMQKFFDTHPEIKVPANVKKAIEDSKEWYVDDFVIER